MLVKIYGLMDLISGLVLMSLKWDFGFFQKLAAFILVGYLVLKSLAYIKSLASVVDLVAAACLVLAAFGVFHIAFYVLVMWLLQKGFSSLFA